MLSRSHARNGLGGSVRQTARTDHTPYLPSSTIHGFKQFWNDSARKAEAWMARKLPCEPLNERLKTVYQAIQIVCFLLTFAEEPAQIPASRVLDQY